MPISMIGVSPLPVQSSVPSSDSNINPFLLSISSVIFTLLFYLVAFIVIERGVRNVNTVIGGVERG